MYDKDLGTTSAKLTYGLKKKVLLGEFDPEPGSPDREMIQAYKASKLSIEKFLDTWKK